MNPFSTAGSRNLAVHENPHPGFEVEQPPDTVPMVAMAGPVLSK
jgi:hypothetical protein